MKNIEIPETIITLIVNKKTIRSRIAKFFVNLFFNPIIKAKWEYKGVKE